MVLVDHVVRKVSGSFPGFVDRQELMSAGRLGLTEAASRYDFDRDIPFAPYATRRIKGAVLDLLRSQDWVPRSIRDTARRADQATGALGGRLGRSPEDSEVAAAIGVGVDDLRATRSAVAHGTVTTLDAGGGDDGDGDVSERLTDLSATSTEELLEQAELHGYLRAALEHLPERLRIIVVGHYVEGRSLDELATLLGVTPSRVSQLRADAVEILRDGIEAQFVPTPEDRPKGRVAIRQATYASAIARHADWRTRLVTTTYAAQGADPIDRSQENHVA